MLESMITVAEKSKTDCCGCGLCAMACPEQAIHMMADDEGFLYPQVDSAKCIKCRKCVTNCIFKKNSEDNRPFDYYAARSKDRQTLMQSASGGIFAEFSKEIMNQKGFVCGAIFNEDFSVKHICSDTAQDCDAMRGSKYLQSLLMPVYRPLLEAVKTGRWVLISGTPCQIVAVKKYLSIQGQDLSKVVFCDIICHGVCSPAVWQEYLSWFRSKHGDIYSVNMRDKHFGAGYNMTIQAQDGEYHRSGEQDPYIRMFQKNCLLRPSCFHCPMKTWNRISDITIGDFQKAKDYFPDFVDGMGISVVMLSSPKGKALWEKICPNMEFQCADQESATQVNLYKQIPGYEVRNIFFEEFKNLEFEIILKKYTEVGLVNRYKANLKRLAKKVLKLVGLKQ